MPKRDWRFWAIAFGSTGVISCAGAPSSARGSGETIRNLTTEELKAVSGGASKNAGGGPGNSGPGDKDSRNERGHGGQPTG